MAPNEEAQHANGKNREDHRAITKDRLAREGRKNMRGRAHAGQNCDVTFGMTEDPKQVLPQKRRAPGMKSKSRIRTCQNAADIFVCGNEEAGEGYTIKQQQDAPAQQHW